MYGLPHREGVIGHKCDTPVLAAGVAEEKFHGSNEIFV